MSVNTSTARHTNIGGTCVIIITIDIGMSNSGFMGISIWITMIGCTFIVIVNWYRGINTTSKFDTFYIGTSIFLFTFIFGERTSIDRFTSIDSTWIFITTVYSLVIATCIRITVVMSTCVIIITAKFTLNTTNCRITRINCTCRRIHTNNRIENTSALIRYTDISGAFVIIITFMGGVDTSLTGFTGIISTRITIITVDVRIITSVGTRASIMGTVIIILANY
jgi:hypothetical protein